jgi:hypothetical protein
MAIIKDLVTNGAHLIPQDVILSDDGSEHVMTFEVTCLRRIDGLSNIRQTDNHQGAVLFFGDLTLNKDQIIQYYALTQSKETYNKDLFTIYESWIVTLDRKNTELARKKLHEKLQEQSEISKTFAKISKASKPPVIKRRNQKPPKP